MAIHLLTTVSGQGWRTLEHTLQHYLGVGVESFHVTLHLADEDDGSREPVTEIVRRFGCGLYDTVIGDASILQETYTKPRREYPRDWFVLAASGELHHYPQSLADLARECESNDWECVYGGVVDRIAAEGRIPEVEAGRTLEEQFPLGALIGPAIGQTHPAKVALVRGAIWVGGGRLVAPYAKYCPPDAAAAVFQYKWHDAAVRALRTRWDFLREPGEPGWRDTERLLEYVDANGGFDVGDPGLRVARCTPDYPYWHEVLNAMKSLMGSGGG